MNESTPDTRMTPNRLVRHQFKIQNGTGWVTSLPFTLSGVVDSEWCWLTGCLRWASRSNWWRWSSDCPTHVRLFSSPPRCPNSSSSLRRRDYTTPPSFDSTSTPSSANNWRYVTWRRVIVVLWLTKLSHGTFPVCCSCVKSLDTKYYWIVSVVNENWVKLPKGPQWLIQIYCAQLYVQNVERETFRYI